MIDRSNWPKDIPAGASGRDAFLIYIQRGWSLFLGGDPPETILDHDFGHHVLRGGHWQLTLVNTQAFPESAYSWGAPQEET